MDKSNHLIHSSVFLKNIYVYLHSFITCISSHIPSQSRYKILPSAQGSLMLPSITRPTSLCLLSLHVIH